jgi:ferrous iron transport protein B
VSPFTAVLVGNPNSGKTTVFNALTGLRQKVGNYPGVTVEKKEGVLTGENGSEAILIDLPGTYSLSPASPDERITVNTLLGRDGISARPDVAVCVVDASNLERNLYLVSQVIDQDLPVVVALTMVDVAEKDGITVHRLALERELGVPVVPVLANRGKGIDDLRHAIVSAHTPSARSRQWRLPEPVAQECDELAGMLATVHNLSPSLAFHEALSLLSSNDVLDHQADRFDASVIDHVRQDRQRLDVLGFDRQSVIVESRYEWIKQVCGNTTVHARRSGRSVSDRIDRVLTHRVWGFVIFFGVMGLMFQAVFTWAAAPMEWIGNGFAWIANRTATLLPPGEIQEMIVHGGLPGVAAVVMFLPQILLLFLFLGFLEDTGYMARAAFIMDKVMSKVGLHGTSFIPLLSSFACAIPGIMATRTIGNTKDRIATMMVAPLMSCSARLPVYTLLIAAFIPATRVSGLVSLGALTMLSMYLLGLVAALAMAWVFKRTLLRGPAPAFLLELPPYKLPTPRSILLLMRERSTAFLRRAGTIILSASIILWYLASNPRVEHATPAEQLRLSYAGRAGQAIEPLVAPLGFDWKIGIGLVSSLLQREVFVSTMGTIYDIQDARSTEGSRTLQQEIRADRSPVTGQPTFTVLTALCIMVYYVLSMQCLSTVVVVYRETNGWRWPLVQIAYMTALAYAVTFLVYRAGLIIGVGG